MELDMDDDALEALKDERLDARGLLAPIHGWFTERFVRATCKRPARCRGPWARRERKEPMNVVSPVTTA
jgi:hypothetical protein